MSLRRIKGRKCWYGSLSCVQHPVKAEYIAFRIPLLQTWDRAEHSMYWWIPSSWASFSPCWKEMGVCLFFLNLSTVLSSHLKSDLVPTSMTGVFGRYFLTSGIHCKTNHVVLFVKSSLQTAAWVSYASDFVGLPWVKYIFTHEVDGMR